MLVPRIHLLTTLLIGLTSIVRSQQNQTKMRNVSTDLSSHPWESTARPQVAPFYKNCSKLLLNQSSSDNTTVNSSHCVGAGEVMELETTLGFSTPVMVLIVLFVFIIILTAVGGNFLTILAFITNKQLRTPHNIYICNLAITDLLVGLASIPFYGIYLIQSFGGFLCKLMIVIDYTICTCSSSTLIMISWDRYLIVTQGAEYNMRQTKTKAVLKVAVCWIFSLLLYSPAILLWDVVRGYSINPPSECGVEFLDSPLFITITNSIDFAIPLTLITTFHILICRNLRNRTKNLKIATSSGSSEPGPSNVQKQPVSNELRKELDKHKKLVLFLSILTATYFACWMPFTIISITTSVCGTCVDDGLYQAVSLLLWLNSSFNPFLYAMTNKDIRKSFRRLLTCKWNRITPFNGN